MDRTVASSVIVPRPGLEVKGAAGPVHSHSLPGGYSQKLGDKFAQGFCDATVKEALFSDVAFPLPGGELFSEDESDKLKSFYSVSGLRQLGKTDVARPSWRRYTSRTGSKIRQALPDGSTTVFAVTSGRPPFSSTSIPFRWAWISRNTSSRC